MAKAQKPLPKLSPAYKAKIAKTKGVFAAFGKKKPKGKKEEKMVTKLGRKHNKREMLEETAKKVTKKVAGGMFWKKVRKYATGK